MPQRRSLWRRWRESCESWRIRFGPLPGAALILGVIPLGAAPPAAAQRNWPETISIPTGFESEGIELGKGDEFCLGAFSFSSFFGAAFGVPHEQSAFAGAIYKGNLRTGEGAILVPPTGKPVSGLSYDPRTDYLYAATGSTFRLSDSLMAGMARSTGSASSPNLRSTPPRGTPAAGDVPLQPVRA
jgi:hypothetical protein